MASPFSATSTSLHNHLGALDALLEVGAFISYPIYHDFVAKIRHLASLPLLMPGLHTASREATQARHPRQQ